MIRIYHQIDENKDTWILEGKKKEKLWRSLGWAWLPGCKCPGAWVTSSRDILSKTVLLIDCYSVDYEIFETI